MIDISYDIYKKYLIYKFPQEVISCWNGYNDYSFYVTTAVFVNDKIILGVEFDDKKFFKNIHILISKFHEWYRDYRDNILNEILN
jgi:hypothetical protein